MPVQHSVRDGGAVIAVQGAFNFSQHQQFRDATASVMATSGLSGIEINLYDTDYMDSSALGMLLVFRDQAITGGVKNLRITGARGAVRQVLEIAKFGKFFNLE